MYGRRVSKSDPRVEAYGSVDELNAALGVARVSCHDQFVGEAILQIQSELITVMGELATAAEDLPRYLSGGFSLTSSSMVDRLTGVIDNLEEDKQLYDKGWAIPGSTLLSAYLDLARTICRRAERRVTVLAIDTPPQNPEILRYLNRLSDLCWLLARFAEKRS